MSVCYTDEKNELKMLYFGSDAAASSVPLCGLI